MLAEQPCPPYVPSAPPSEASRSNDTRKGKVRVRVNLNLVEAAKRLLYFLAQVDKCPYLYKGTAVQRAIERYERYWLPLAAKHGGQHLIAPPLDVHWVWLVHLLAPQHYVHDVTAITGTLVNHRLLTAQALEKARDKGREFWEQAYEEPWDALPCSSVDEKCSPPSGYISRITYDLEAAVGRQSAFYYQVSLPHYRSKGFLRHSEKRYKQFLWLKKNKPDTFLVPCYDMDIVWHAHQVHPVIYKNDTEAIIGHMLPHDDSVNDRSPGSRLCTSDAATRDLWGTTFGTTFRKAGAMFRGDPPEKYLKKLPESVKVEVQSCLYHLHITKLTIQGTAPNGSLKIKIKHETRKLAELNLVHKTEMGSSEHDVSDLDLHFSIPDHMVTKWIVLKMAPSKKLSWLLRFVGQKSFWCMEDLSDLINIKEKGTLVKNFTDNSTVVQVKFEVRKERVCNWSPLSVLTGDFTSTTLSRSLLTSLYGIVTPDSQADNEEIFLAQMATHRLVNEIWPQKPQVLEVEVFHSSHFMFSAVHIYADSSSGRSLVALAHTVDANTLPSPQDIKCNENSNLKETLALCDTSKGERAMVIKAGGCDWALVVGRWDGFRQGVRGTVAVRGKPGSPGRLVLRVHRPPDKAAETVVLPYTNNLFAFHVQDLYMDIENGVLQVQNGAEDLIENLALGLCITVLHVLCQPRILASDFRDDEVDGDVGKAVTEGGDLSDLYLPSPNVPNRIPVEQLKLLGALGFFCAAAPTNALRRQTVQKNSRAGENNQGYFVDPVIIAGATCGSCGGCGGCGGGAFSGGCDWGKSYSGHNYESSGGGEAGDMGVGGGDGGGDWGGGWSGGVGPAGCANAEDASEAFSSMFGFIAETGGGDGGDCGGGGDGGGCGGCGGCGG